MKYNFKISIFVFLLVISSSIAYAGNPDRQGEAGAQELLFNPWARSAGLHGLNTSSIMGVEAMRLNIAGLSRINSTEIVIANTRLFQGSDMKLNAFGLAQKMGEGSAFGLSLVAVDFGDIPVTTTSQPEGTGATFSPSFFHFGAGYSYTYSNKISVGVLFRGISESTTNVSAFGFALDAGVQYVTGDNDNFKLGISLRNMGSTMKFEGGGLSTEVSSPGDNPTDFITTLENRSEKFQLPSVLNIGVSYDFISTEDLVVRGMGNFTGNAFSRDDIGVGAEVFIKNYIGLRAGYKLALGETLEAERNVYTGVAAGISLNLPFSGLEKGIGIDYAYRTTDPFEGTHNFSLRISL